MITVQRAIPGNDHGGRGIIGIYSNLSSITYGSHWRLQVPNPTLSAMSFSNFPELLF
jgi:hypothetical protein